MQYQQPASLPHPEDKDTVQINPDTIRSTAIDLKYLMD